MKSNSLTVVGDVLDRCVVRRDRDAQGHLVAAGRVDVVHLGTEWLTQATTVRMFVVIQDHLLVHLLHPHQRTPKKLWALTIASTSASTSAVVLYAANDARAVAATPKRRCNGQAQ